MYCIISGQTNSCILFCKSFNCNPSTKLQVTALKKKEFLQDTICYMILKLVELMDGKSSSDEDII